MMRWQVPQNNGADEIDEHDLPTEPIPYDVASPSSSNVSNGANPSYYDEMFPAPQPVEQPFPRQYVPGMSQQGVPGQIPGAGNYPVLPSPARMPGAGSYPVVPPRAPTFPKSKGKHGAGDATPVSADQAAKKASARVRRNSRAPMWVGLFFVAVQLLLLIRFVLVIIHGPDTIWVELVFGLSTLFVWPFRALLAQVSLPFPVWPEVYTLLAILLYGMLSRILVRFLKAILPHH